MDPANFDKMSRDELVAKARSLGVERPELMTRVELGDEIVRRSQSDPAAQQRARGWLGVARDLVASVVGSGLSLPDAAALIRGDRGVLDLKGPSPVATVTLAEIYATQGHLERALSMLDEVLAREPEHAAAHALRDRLSNEPRARRVEPAREPEFFAPESAAGPTPIASEPAPPPLEETPVAHEPTLPAVQSAPPYEPPPQDPAPVYEAPPELSDEPPPYEGAHAVYEPPPAYEPAPAVYEPPPAYEPAPAVYQAPAQDPAPAEASPVHEPAPGMHEAQPAYEPAPGMHEAQPAYEPAPGMHEAQPAYEPAPAAYEAPHAPVYDAPPAYEAAHNEAAPPEAVPIAYVSPASKAEPEAVDAESAVFEPVPLAPLLPDVPTRPDAAPLDSLRSSHFEVQAAGNESPPLGIEPESDIVPTLLPAPPSEPLAVALVVVQRPGYEPLACWELPEFETPHGTLLELECHAFSVSERGPVQKTLTLSVEARRGSAILPGFASATLIRVALGYRAEGVFVPLLIASEVDYTAGELDVRFRPPFSEQHAPTPVERGLVEQFVA